MISGAFAAALVLAGVVVGGIIALVADDRLRPEEGGVAIAGALTFVAILAIRIGSREDRR